MDHYDRAYKQFLIRQWVRLQCENIQQVAHNAKFIIEFNPEEYIQQTLPNHHTDRDSEDEVMEKVERIYDIFKTFEYFLENQIHTFPTEHKNTILVEGLRVSSFRAIIKQNVVLENSHLGMMGKLIFIGSQFEL